MNSMNNNEQLQNKRHTLAHLLAAATLALYPDTKLTLGPATDTGFYYDMEFADGLSDNALPKIQKRMKKMLSSWKEFTHEVVSADDTRLKFADNPYKLELIDEIEERGEDITLYTIAGFTDLCRGGHSDNPAAEIKADTFQLDKVAGAYWRGDENNAMLTRIYGFCFKTAEELENHLEMLKLAKERDHRKIGKEMNLFTFSDLIGPGLPLFTPRGTLIRDLVMQKIQRIQRDFGYQGVTTPHITKPDLYQKSGHWEKFGEELFHVTGKAGGEFVMKPMNCPHHTQIFASTQRSYRDLPQRFMETGVVYRDEQAGELMGLSRVRSISQDDGHVFCRPDQIEQEVGIIVDVIKEFYTSLEMWNEGTYWVSLSVRNPETPEKYLGDDKLWDEAEKTLESIAKQYDLPYKRVEGEAAFYGPKLDFMFHDALGRERQLATAQLDFNLPNRFELEYTDSDGEKKRPVMIHRAIAGSLERFMAVMIEHFGGHFPVWLSPDQLVILPVAESHVEFAQTIYDELKNTGVRVSMPDASDRLGKRIRDAKTSKIPYIMVIGDNEKDSGKLKLEGREDLEGLSIEEITAKFTEINTL